MPEIIKGAAYWASYLINDDDSGLEPWEREECDAWLERNDWPNILDVGEPYFSWAYGYHTGSKFAGGDLADYTISTPAVRVQTS